MLKNKFRGLVIFLLASIPFFMVQCSKGPGENNVLLPTINIGVMLPLTGNIAFIGENFKNGMLLALENSKTKHKSQIIFSFEDHKNSPKDGVAIFSRFSEDNKMPLIVPTITSITNAIIPLAKDNPKVLLGSIISGSDMPDRSEWLFRYFLSTPDEVTTVVKYLDNKGIDEIGVFYVNDDYGLDAKRVFMNSFKGKVLFNEPFDKSISDFKNFVPKALGAKALYILGYGNTYGTFIKQLRIFGYKGALFCFSSFSTPVAIKEAGEYGKDVIFTGTIYTNAAANSEIGLFKGKYAAKYGKEPDHYSVYGYDIANIILKVIDEILGKGDSPSPINIRQTILAWKEYNGLLGRTIIEPNKDFRFAEIKLFRLRKDGSYVEIAL